METIKEHIIQLNSLLYRIRIIFANRYSPTHEETTEDFYDLDIPTIWDDKANRKSDIKAIGNDMKKALKEKEKELAHVEK